MVGHVEHGDMECPHERHIDKYTCIHKYRLTTGDREMDRDKEWVVSDVRCTL